MAGDDATTLDRRDVDDAALARDAVIWGFPLLLMGRYLAAAGQADLDFDRFYMSSEIATPRSHAVGPNIDTLNGRAWLDLSDGPQVIGVPDTADRYYSVQLQDMYMNSFAYIGRRTTGTRPGWFAITPPGYAGSLPDNVTEIRATTGKVLAFVRTLVRGPDDIEAVRAINAAFTIGKLAAFPAGQHAAFVGPAVLDRFQPAGRSAGRSLPHEEIAASGTACFDELDRLLHDFPPLAADAPNLARFARLGIGRGQPATRPPELQALLPAAVAAGVAAPERGLKTSFDNGWLRRPNVEPFIADPVQRAANNIYGPNTQIAAESVFYNKRRGPDGKTLNGSNRYRLRFAPDQTPPVDGFWSLTLYDKAYRLHDNAIDRYGITNHTERLRHGPDGSLEIGIQPDAPTGQTVNWLPCPPDDFQLVLRTYQPRAAILDRSYLPPPLELIGNGTEPDGASRADQH